MKITGKTRRELLTQNIIYYLLLLTIAGTAGWLSVRYNMQSDWSVNNRNTLNEVSREIAQKIDGVIQITAFIADDEIMRSAVRDLIGRYQRYKKDIELEFVNPQTSPGRTREMNITGMGEIVIQYGNAQERLQTLNEQTLTNALQRLLRSETRWVVFLTGHGELDPYAQTDAGLAKFTARADQQGFSIQSLNLLATPDIPDNTRILVLASPQKDYLAGEIEIVLDYIRRGGNLLWLTEPESGAELGVIGKELGIARLPGVVVDAAGQLFGITQPDFVLVVNYPDGEIMRDINEFTLFPQAVGLTAHDDNPLRFSATTLLQTLARSWTEAGPIEGNIEFNENTEEIAGPIDIGISLTRTIEQVENNANLEQRIVVIGDGDFMTNGFIGYGSNLLFSTNLFNWLSHDDDLISIDAVSAPDTQLNIGTNTVLLIMLVFLFIIPLTLVATGIAIWLRRRKK